MRVHTLFTYTASFRQLRSLNWCFKRNRSREIDPCTSSLPAHHLPLRCNPCRAWGGLFSGLWSPMPLARGINLFWLSRTVFQEWELPVFTPSCASQFEEWKIRQMNKWLKRIWGCEFSAVAPERECKGDSAKINLLPAWRSPNPSAWEKAVKGLRCGARVSLLKGSGRRMREPSRKQPCDEESDLFTCFFFFTCYPVTCECFPSLVIYFQ